MPTSSLILASAVAIAIVLGFSQRLWAGKGIGWQFIRVMAVVTGMPIAGVLALNGLENSQAMTLLALVIGFAFGKSEGGGNA